MNTPVLPTSPAGMSPAGAAIAPPELRHARFEDYAQIAALEKACDLESQPESDWRSVWLNNPLWPRLQSTWPLGWVLEDAAGAIVGSVMNVPSLYTFKGRDLVCANGRAWAAAPQYRGFALILMDEYFNQDNVDLFVNTTVGPMAVQILSELTARVPLGDWESISYWITYYRGFAQKALAKMGVPLPRLLAGPAALALRLKDALLCKSLPGAPAGYEIAEITNFDSRFDDFWKQLVVDHAEKLLAARDRASLAWHFAIPLRRGRVRIFTAVKDGLLRAYCILKRHDISTGISRMRLVDFQTLDPSVDLLSPLLKPALRKCAREKIDILDHLGRGVPKMKSVDDAAPYRQKFPNWPFYYRATDPALAAELAPPAVWDPSSYDGDASFE